MGQTVLELETDKAVVEVFDGGRHGERGAGEGRTEAEGTRPVFRSQPHSASCIHCGGNSGEFGQGRGRGESPTKVR